MNRTQSKSKPDKFSRIRNTLRAVLGWVTLIAISGEGLATLQIKASSEWDEEPKWKTGVEWERQLSNAVSVTYTGVPLRENLVKFSRHEGIALFIDRRVDPGILISMTEANFTFEQALWKLAANNNLGACQLGELYYLGPPEVAMVLPVLWNDMKTSTNRPGRQKTKWSKRTVINWPMLNQPNETLEQLARTHQFKVHTRTNGAIKNAASIQALPHDVWPEMRLPAISLDEQVALLLVGFGLWFERNDEGSEIKIIDFPAVRSGEITWRGLTDMKKMLPQLKSQFSSAKFSIKGKTLIAHGQVANLSEISKWLVAERKPAKGKLKVYSLKTHATRKQILATICRGRTLEYAPELSRIMDERIEFSVENVGLEELIRKVLQNTDLKFTLSQDQLKIQK
jgi:hypothetical protein